MSRANPGPYSGLVYDLRSLEERVRPPEEDEDDWNRAVQDGEARSDPGRGAYSLRLTVARHLNTARRLLELLV